MSGCDLEGYPEDAGRGIFLRQAEGREKQFLGQLAISSDNGESQCLSMGKSLVSLGTIFTDRQNIEAIEAVTSEGIRNAALRIFNPESTSSLIFL